jgi:SAM-dependent methyltransferase
MSHHPSTVALHLLFASVVGLASCSDAPQTPPQPPAAPAAPAAAAIAEPPVTAAEPAAEPTAAAAAAPTETAKAPDVIYVPTPQPVVDRMLEVAKVKKSDVVYDLGCGDGRIVVTAAKKYGARGVGYDIDPKRVAEAKENVKKAGVENLVTIEQKDIFTLDLSPASVVTLYLLPRLNVRLLPQLEKLKPGSRVVTHDFDIEGYKPEKRIDMKAIKDDADQTADHVIYSFITPLKPVAAKAP